MKDRVPRQPGRVLVTPEGGSAPFYATLTRADNPTQEGTPLNKATLLTDETASLMGGAVQTPDEAFRRLLLLSQEGGMVVVQVTSSDGSPVENLKVTGLLNIAKNPVFTNSEGKAVGIAEAGKRTIGISGYADVVDSTQSVQIENGSIYELSFTVSSRNYLNISSARNIMFSPNVATIDYDVVGAGGGGGGQDRFFGGAGGGGGAIQTVTGVSVVPNQVYPVIIGAGGTTDEQHGNPGGQSSFMETVAEGGQGGKNEGYNGIGGEGGQPGGGRGGNREGDGAPGGMRFSSFTQTEMCSGGGGGARGRGGDGGGGNGGADNSNGKPGQKPGAGGGGGGAPDDSVDWQTYGGKGHDGCVDIRMHLTVGAK